MYKPPNNDTNTHVEKNGEEKMKKRDAEAEIRRLSDILRKQQYEYYVLGAPSVSDLEYDRLFDRLQELEEAHPDLVSPDSPTRRVGSDLSNELPEVRHTVPVLSLDKAYSSETVLAWMRRTAKKADQHLSFSVEEKIDGVSIVLYYHQGSLQRAVTRGNGYIGNDVTENIRTIGSVPLRLPEPANLAVRGEIYLPKDRFERMKGQNETEYANPRNLAAGTIRRIRSSEVAAVPLTIFVYEAYLLEDDGEPSESGYMNHVEILKYLHTLGFRLNPSLGVFVHDRSVLQTLPEFPVPTWTAGTFDELDDFIRKETSRRRQLDYEIDGLVVKVNEIPVRRELGFTGHHPRWAMAYKFEAPQGETVVRSIDVQVGRTGRITPVARVEPVLIGGSTVSNVTLHNQDYVDLLELSVGDSVAVSKRGDVIPAVEKVLDKNPDGTPGWRMPETCPSCSQPLQLRGAHTFCVNPLCPAQVRGRIYFFIGRNQMDIENFGPETAALLMEKGVLKDLPDIYSTNYDAVLTGEPGFGEKKIQKIKEGVEKSRQQPFRVVLPSLGIPDIGKKAAELLIEAGYRDIDTLISLAESENGPEQLTQIAGFGKKTAQSIVEALQDPAVRERIEGLRAAGLNFREKAGEKEENADFDDAFAGQVWCVTGSFEHFKPRTAAMDEVKRRGGRVVSTVTGKTTHLLAGEGAGSKLVKAQKQGTIVVSEEEFLEMCRDSSETNSGKIG